MPHQQQEHPLPPEPRLPLGACLPAAARDEGDDAIDAADIVKNAVANISRKTGRSPAEALATLVATNPQGRLVSSVEVANAVVWLCRPGSESVTGQSLVLAGGEVT